MTSSSTMRAVRFFGVNEPLRIGRIAVPSPGPDEVRVAIRACGICGSDVHLVRGLIVPGPLPMTLGHEPSGVIDAVGPGATGLELGQRVAVAAGFGCGNCDACQRDAENLCDHVRIPGIHRDGSQAEYVVVPARTALPLPDNVDFATGAILTDAVGTPYHAVLRSGVQPGQTAVVYGLGGLGLHAVMILAQVVGAHVIGVDTYPGALERAKRFGASELIDASAGDPAQSVLEMTDGGADVSFEFVGTPAVVDQAVKSLHQGGTCTVVGVGPQPLHLDLPQTALTMRELRLQGSCGSTLGELAELINLVGKGALSLEGTITHRFPLDRFSDGLRLVETKEDDPIRVVIEQPG